MSWLAGFQRLPVATPKQSAPIKALRNRLEELEARDVPATYTLFDTTVAPPAQTATFDTASVSLGVEFTVEEAGYVDHVKFYRGVAIDSGYSARLWRADGTLLGSGIVVEGQGPTPGWQAVYIGRVSVVPGETYVAAYYASRGGYSYTYQYFDTGVTVGPLTASQSDESTQNGLYRYGTNSGTIPTQSYRASNYWVTPVFTTADIPTISSLTPNSGTTAGGQVVEITGSNFTAGGTPRVFFGGTEGTVTSATNTQLLVQTPAHAAGQVDVRVQTSLGSSANTAADNYTYTAPALPGTYSVWSNSVTPGTPIDPDTAPVELGVRFTVDAVGQVLAVRFYRGVAIDSGYTVHLWDADGNLLGSGLAVEGQGPTPGWQRVDLNNPVTLQTGRTYIASYYASQGRYAADEYGLTNGIDTGPINLLPSNSEGGNGVYRYGLGGGFPTFTYNDSNYWVDVLYRIT